MTLTTLPEKVRFVTHLLRLLPLVLMLTLHLRLDAQSTDALSAWLVVQDCFPEAQPRPDDYTFPGFIASYVPDDGIRALRAETFTTYYLAFAGSNFIEAAAFSPSGRWLALPYGFIETAGMFDIRNDVDELRVMSTGTFPQISARVAWQASFQQGDLTQADWLDDETFLFPQGSFLDGQTVQQVQAFTNTITPVTGDVYEMLSPDRTRGFRLDSGRLALLDLAAPSNAPLADLPEVATNLSGIVWSPDSSQFAALEADTDSSRWLSLYSRDGEHIARLFDLTTDHLLANVNWSPDGTQLAFSAYDPYDNENALYLADLTSESVSDTCTLLNTRYTHAPTEALAWSPDGASLALALPEGFYLYDGAAAALYYIGDDIGGLMDWKLGE